MSFDWEDYIRLSEKLIKKTGALEEASLRSSISRGYYGVFCIARNKKNYQHYKARNVHQEVINKYKNSGDKRERKIGKGLDELRKARNDADYNENKLINRSLAERALIMAKQIRELVVL